MSLAAKLPYDHPYAGGYPGIGSQPLPTDTDALDYLARVKAADGAGVETAVAVAVSAFITALKADSLWDAIGASGLLCGPRTLAGALVPLRGPAPTAQGGWASGDYDRSTGMTGDGTALYLDSNRPANADDQNDNHWAIYIATPQTVGGRSSFGSGDNVAVSYHYHRTATGGSLGKPQLQNNVATNYNTTNELEASGLSATSRSSGSAYDWASGGDSGTINQASVAPSSYNAYVFAINSDGSDAIHSDATISFYSIGTSIDLAKLDSHVSAYVTAIGAAL